jgi:cation transporter-like permease
LFLHGYRLSSAISVLHDSPNKQIHAMNIQLAQIIAMTGQNIAQSGLTLGAVIAVVCSWQRNRSILFAIIAGILSWFYVIYFALTRTAEETK